MKIYNHQHLEVSVIDMKRELMNVKVYIFRLFWKQGGTKRLKIREVS